MVRFGEARFGEARFGVWFFEFGNNKKILDTD